MLEGAELSQAASELAARVTDRRAHIVELDIGDENILQPLHEMGYSKLYGTSARQKVYDMPHYTSIRYLYSGSSRTHFPPFFFDCCVALGPRTQVNLGEVSEILKQDGLLVIPPSREMEVRGAARFGLEKTYSVGAALDCYRKTRGDKPRREKAVSILVYAKGAGGIAEYARLLARRFAETGASAEIVESPQEVSSETALVEYANGLARGRDLLNDVKGLTAQGKRVLVEVHDTLERFPQKERTWLQGVALLLYRANESAERDGVTRYFLAPHTSYTPVPLLPPETKAGVTLGSFGFAARYKRTHLLVRLARRLNVPLRLMVSLNEETGVEKSLEATRQLAVELGTAITGPGTYRSGDLEVRVGFFAMSEISEEMAGCSHIIFAHTSSNLPHSGVMTLAKRFSRPIVALESFQARQAQVVRTQSFFKLQALQDASRSFAAQLLHRKPEVRRFLGAVARIASEQSLSKEFLVTHSAELSRDEDGFEYIDAVLSHPE